MTAAPRPVVLCILDGWGHREAVENNAIAQARTPVWDRLVATCPHSLLEASNADVGLPDGQMGNSEVGHMNIGAGRVVMQNLPRIDQAVADGSLAANPTLEAFIDALSESGGACHLMGLMSPGGVHSHQRHIAALARAVAGRGVPVAVPVAPTRPIMSPAKTRCPCSSVSGTSLRCAYRVRVSDPCAISTTRPYPPRRPMKLTRPGAVAFTGVPRAAAKSTPVCMRTFP